MKRLFILLCLLCSTLAQAESRLERVIHDGALRVCIWPDYFGISWRDPRTQSLSGVDVDLARELGKSLGVEVRFIDSSFARLIDDVTQDRCDVAMFAIGIIPARAEKLDFTQPHLASDIYGITSRSNRTIRNWADIDRPGVIVAVAKGTLHETVMKDKLRQATLLVTTTAAGREAEVEAGRADVFMTDYPFSRRMLAQTDWARLVAPESTYHITRYAWAVAKGDAPWLARLNQFVAEIKRDGRLKTFARRYQLEPIVVAD